MYVCQAALEDMRRATDAMRVAEEKVQNTLVRVNLFAVCEYLFLYFGNIHLWFVSSCLSQLIGPIFI